ncbi:MAG: glycosyltransferase family 39 protein [Deltaproteobacteria bacterium]|nr:glycosyltransferase family 39 protein [Deltaproteobacteria bacterium]
MNLERNKVLGILLLAATVMLGIAVRLPGTTRGLATENWREADIAAIARNFSREGMDPLHPRVDWRGDGPGYAEMEFPFLPWTTACLYNVFGVHIAIGRILSLSASVLSLLLFAALARRVLPGVGALAATAFYALNPLSIWLSSALQPEPFMMAATLAAVLALHRWLEGQRNLDYAIALVALAVALLAKLTAIHIGLVFAILILQRYGRETWKQGKVWLLAAGALLPAAAWYLHAHHLWKAYGNSLGLSNEYHWLGLDLLAHPSSLLGIPHTELLWVFMRTGAAMAVLGIACARSARPFRFELVWLGATWLYYLAAARTTADSWAFYYHIASVPPAALLVGRALSAAWAIPSFGAAVHGHVPDMAGAMGKPQGIGSIVNSQGLPVLADHGQAPSVHDRGSPSGLPMPPGIRRWLRSAAWEGGKQGVGGRLQRAGAVALLALCLLEEAHVAHRERNGTPPSKMLSCATEFSPLIPKDALVVASGGPCIDETSKPVAFNASYAFYWLDRKGFNTCQQRQSLDALGEFERRGARYFVMENDAAAATPGFAEAVRQDYLLKAQCAEAALFELGGRRTSNREHGNTE